MKLQDACDAVDAARRKHDVPGVNVAFYADGEIALTASGIANVSTDVEMTTDTIAHVGSITKLINATVVMQLVDRGLISLEAPVTRYLPEFRLENSDDASAITIEMLLNHTSGLGANLLPDMGHDLETLERTFGRMVMEPQLHAPGAARSYCNAGTVIAGYLCQRLTKSSWYDLVKRNVFEALDLKHAAVLPEDAILHRASVGHFLDPAEGKLTRTSRAFLPLGFAPAGSTNMMSAGDLMTFVRAHMSGGVGSNGVRILSEESAERMRRQSANPGPSAFDSGIGWRRFRSLVGHGGGGPGIVSYVSAHVESQSAVVVLTNAEHGLGVLQDVISPFMKAHAGVDPLPALPAPKPDLPVKADRYVGTYENNTVLHEVSARNGELYWTATAKHEYYDSTKTEKPAAVRLIPAAPDWFLADASASALTHSPTALVGFLDPDTDGRARFLVEQLWLYRRISA